MRFRLSELIVVMAILCFLTGALVKANGLFECLFMSFTVGFTLFSILMAIAKRGAARAYWTGFAVGCGLYLLCTFYQPKVDRNWITTAVLKITFKKLHDETIQPPTNVIRFTPSYNPYGSTGQAVYQTPSGVVYSSAPVPQPAITDSWWQVFESNSLMVSYIICGECGWALFLGWMSAHFLCAAYNRSQRDSVKAEGIQS